MNYKIQLVSFLVSFLFGIFLYFTSLLNYKFIQKLSIFIKYVVTFVYIVDVALLYVLFMYKINYGVIHIYFLLLLFCGFLFGFFYSKKLRKICKVLTKKLKR